MKTALRIIGWAFGVLILLVLVAGGAGYVFLTSDYVRGKLESETDKATGRTTKIGKLAIDWGWTTRIHIEDIQISNTDWGKAPHMFEAKEIEADLRIPPLFHLTIELPRLRLVNPVLSMEKSLDDDSNWSPKESPVAATTVRQAAPSDRAQTPLIGRLEIVEGKLAYHDAKRHLDIDGTVTTATGKAGEESDRAELTMKGKLENEPLSLHFTGGSILMLRDTAIPYPLDLDITYGDTHLTVKGKIQDPFQFKGGDVLLTLSGKDMAQVYPLLGIPGPPTPPYRLSGHLNRDKALWKVDDLVWHVGGSDISGKLTEDEGQKPAKLTAELTSQNLLFDDLAPLIGASPGDNGSEQQKAAAQQIKDKGELFPDVPLHVERLRAMSMDVTLDAKKVMAPDYLPINSLFAHIVIEEGKLRARPLKLGFGGGTLSGELDIDANPDPATVHTDLHAKGVALAEFFRNTKYFDTTAGKLDGHILLTGSGKSLAAVMGSADGNIAFGMAGGSISNMMISLANLQLGSVLILYITGDGRIPLNCAMGKMTFEHGMVSFDRTQLDTTHSVLHFDGKAILADQTLDTSITADPKKFDLLDLHSPVLIKGKLRDPKISLGKKIPIPAPELGGAKGLSCDQAVKDVLGGG
jgi:uncharacterized protein involved in outer membrane biogenesis